VANAFFIFTLPFMLAEVATGVASPFFDPLKIPPILGLGTVVDCIILVVGLMFSILRASRSGAGESDTGLPDAH